MSAPLLQDTEAILPAEQEVDGSSFQVESGAVAGAAESALAWPNSDLYKETNCISLKQKNCCGSGNNVGLIKSHRLENRPARWAASVNFSCRVSTKSNKRAHSAKSSYKEYSFVNCSCS